jgi:hypothetical protein
MQISFLAARVRVPQPLASYILTTGNRTPRPRLTLSPPPSPQTNSIFALWTMVRIFHGEISGDPYRAAKSISSTDLDPKVANGDLVCKWDHYFEWDDACVPPRELEKLRWTGDDVCDRVVEFLGMGKGDLLAKLEEYMAAWPREKWDSRVEEFWRTIETAPPSGVDVSDGKFVPQFNATSPVGTLSRGQEVFWRYISPISTSLLHFSLVGTTTTVPKT